MSLALDDRVTVEVGAPAHGGHCVARADGQVVFVRHALPGERVVAQVTSLGPKGRFARADAVSVEQGHPQRVTPTCPAAGPGGCGGCDWLHASAPLARQLKSQVLDDAMAQFAGVRPGVAVADLGGNPQGLGWRTRAGLAVDQAGRAGLRRHRSNEVAVLDACPQLVDPSAAGAFSRRWEPGATVRYVAPATGRALAFPAGRPPRATVAERAAGRTWQVAPEGFWQVHPRAGDVLVDAVRTGLTCDGPVADLYGGVGLLGQGALGSSASGRLVVVESDARAVALARGNVDAGVEVVRAPVAAWVARPDNVADLAAAILDPPRSGAGRTVLESLSRAPALQELVYVACDPVALARDTATLTGLGWDLAGIAGFDLFPSTQHFEVVARFAREPGPGILKVS